MQDSTVHGLHKKLDFYVGRMHEHLAMWDALKEQGLPILQQLTNAHLQYLASQVLTTR